MAQYISERPELTPHGEKSKKAKNSNKRKNKMKKLNITFATILLVLGCFLLSPSAQTAGADDGRSIVGLWNVHYFIGTTEIFQTYDQWHSDGLEFEVNSIAPGAVCQGTWKRIQHDNAKLFHVIWTFDANGTLTGHIEEVQINTVSHSGNTYAGTFDQKFYDLNGNLTGEATGTISATRISVD